MIGTCWVQTSWASDAWVESSWAEASTPPTPQWKDGLYMMVPMGGGVVYLKQL
jgi:hypothetical protein